MEDKNIYDVVIIGGGASGLFCGATYGNHVNGLILEKTQFTGKKLLMSGGGQCNITHGGDIKDFVNHYGENGKKIRGTLYKFNNRSLIEFFESKGIPMIQREDGKVFPKELDAKVILNMIRNESNKKGFKVMYEHALERIEFFEGIYKLVCKNAGTYEEVVFESRKIVVATGGCSYPTTGSDGSMFPILEQMGIEIVKPKPALVQIFVKEYPYAELSGISFPKVKVKVAGQENQDDLLLTHTSFSGPAIINISRFARVGDTISINYFPGKTFEEIFSDLKKKVAKNSKQTTNFLLEYLGTAIPKRFIDVLCKRAEIDENQKSASLSGKQIKRLAELLTKDSFLVEGTGGFNVAMVTAGGVALSEVNLKTMECKKYPGMFFIGEVLDADGDTGGYNLQFACSSGYLAGNSDKDGGRK